MLIGSLLVFGLSGLAPSSPGQFVNFRPLTLEELYGKRMRFAGGEPFVSIGIMEAQREVTLTADGPIRLMFDEDGEARTVIEGPAQVFTFRVENSRPAVVRYWLVVSDHPYGDVVAAEASKDRWKGEGAKVKAFVTGTIVALKGNVLDTRRRQVGIGGFKQRSAATKVSQRLFKKIGLRTVIREELVTLPSGTIGIYGRSGRQLYGAQNVVYFGTVLGARTTVKDVEHSRGYRRHGRQTRKFWDHIYVVLDREGKLTVVNSVGTERLLGGLVPAEIFSTAPLEALKAQAVTARGEVFSKLGHRHFAEPFHLCSEQHCQVYAGATREKPATNEAVAKTRGLLAVRPRPTKRTPLHLVDSVYSSTCGGYTEDNEIVWDTPPSESLRARLDGNPNDPALAPFRDGLNNDNIRAWLNAYPPTYGARSSFAKPKKLRWKKRFPAAKLKRLLRKTGVGLLEDLRILGRGRGGRVTGVRLVGSRRSVDILRELPVRRLFGNLNSGMFVVDVERHRNGRLSAVTFTGGGWGHGVGMCQIGAIGRAEAGQTFRQILEHYYNGAVVDRLY